MNNKTVNIVTAALNKVLDCIPSIHTIGEKVYLAEQAHSMRARIDAQDDLLTQRQMELLQELTRTVKRRGAHSEIEPLLAEFLNIAETRAKLEAVDDQLHAKSHSYTKAISKFYGKAHALLQSACSGLDSLIQQLCERLRKKEAM